MKNPTINVNYNSVELTDTVLKKLNVLESFASCYDDYVQLQKMLPQVDFTLLVKRLNAYQLLKNFLKTGIAELKSFQSFDELERYILDHKSTFLVFETDPILIKNNVKIRENVDEKMIKNYVRIEYPNVCGFYFESAMKAYKTTYCTFEEVFKTYETFVQNKGVLEFFGKTTKLSFSQLLKDTSYNNMTMYRDIVSIYQNTEIVALRRKIKEDAINNQNELFFFYRQICETLKYGVIKDFFRNLPHHIVNYEQALSYAQKITCPFNLTSLAAKSKKVLYFEKNKMIIEINQFEDVKQFGSSAWCISTNRSQWENYVTRKKGRFFILYDETKKNMLGATVVKKSVRNQDNEEETRWCIESLYDINNQRVELYDSPFLINLLKYLNTGWINKLRYRFRVDPYNFHDSSLIA